MMRWVLLIWLMVLGLAGCATAPKYLAGIAQEVQLILETQVAEWNRGNLAGFMETYAKSEATRFASGGDVIMGWQTVFDRYKKKYGTPEAMGKLSFSDLDVKVLAPDAALAFGRWHLAREKDQPSGLFTLLFRKMPDGWRIVHDHTSAASP